VETKNWIALGTLAVSLFAAWAAFDARETAHRLEQKQFESGATIQLLSTVFNEITNPKNPKASQTNCIFVTILALAEKDAKELPPHRVEEFVERVSAAGLWEANCQTRLESLDSAEPIATKIDDNPASLGNEPTEIGQWHALIASYSVSVQGCNEAKADVQEFAALLSGSNLAESFIYVARTKISNNYAVTVDAGDDFALAGTISKTIHSVADQSADSKTGSDSFVQGNRDWFIDPQCTLFARIEG